MRLSSTVRGLVAVVARCEVEASFFDEVEPFIDEIEPFFDFSKFGAEVHNSNQ